MHFNFETYSSPSPNPGECIWIISITSATGFLCKASMLDTNYLNSYNFMTLYLGKAVFWLWLMRHKARFCGTFSTLPSISLCQRSIFTTGMITFMYIYMSSYSKIVFHAPYNVFLALVMCLSLHWSSPPFTLMLKLALVTYLWNRSCRHCQNQHLYKKDFGG